MRLLGLAIVIFSISVSLPASTNAQVWQQSAGLAGGWIDDLIVDSAGVMWAASHDSGFYRSDDGGQSWGRLRVGTEDQRFASVVSNGNGTIFVGTSYGHLYTSGDDGVTWSQCPFELYGSSVRILVWHPSGSIIVGTSNGDLFRSDDGGVSWPKVWDQFPLGGFGLYVMYAMPDGNLFAGTAADLWVSINLGDFWSQLPVGPGGSPVVSIVVENDSTIHAACAFRFIYSTTDGGATWDQHLKGFDVPVVDQIIKNSSDHLIAGSYYEGVYFAADLDAWFKLGKNWPMARVTKIVEYENRLVVGSAQGVLYLDCDSIDSDGDGVFDCYDLCPGSNDNVDSDGDFVPDNCDQCPGSDDLVDTDYDNVADGCDICPGSDDHLDTDNDSIPTGCDNCPEVYNPDQEDNNSDGVGNACCCGLYTSGYTGNIDCDVLGKRNLADITSLIDHVYINKQPLCCPANGNIDGDPEQKVNLADITALIDHVYISKLETAPCE